MTEPLQQKGAVEHQLSVPRPVYLVAVLGWSAVVIASLLMGNYPAAIIAIVVLAVALIANRMYRAGAHERAAWVMIVPMLFVALAGGWHFGTYRSVTTVSVFGAVVLAGIFVGRRLLAVTLTAGAAIYAFLMVSERMGWIHDRVQPPDVAHWLGVTVTITLCGLAVHYAREVAIAAMKIQEEELRERRQAEREALQAEERLRLSMEATRQGWFDLDVRTGAVVSSEQFRSLVGSESTTLSRQNWIDSIHRDDRARVLREYEKCLQSDRAHTMDYRLRLADGEWHWIRSIAKVVERGDDGAPLRMTGTHADITEQREAEVARSESEARYRALVDHTPIAIAVHRQGRFIYANPAALSLIGASSTDDLVDRPVLDIVHPDDRPAAIARMADAIDNNVAAPLLHERLVRLDGGRLDALVQNLPIVFEGKRAVQVTCLDITERRQIEELRLRSQKLEALGTLAGGIAHDFNNILSAIRGNVELAREAMHHEPEAAAALVEIEKAGQRATELVRRITAFGRPKEPSRDIVHLPSVLAEVLKLLRPTTPTHIALRVHEADALPPVLADASQVHEALVNLTANSTHAIGTEAGAIDYSVNRVELSIEQAERLRVSAGTYVALSVTDTGCGMDADTVARVFDVFFTTKEVGEGTGLGLPMVYGIMQSHRGAIAVESTPGAGSTFHLYFPAADAKSLEANTGAHATDAPKWPPRRILFVDDEQPLVHLAERSLAKEGHAVVGFVDPRDALGAFLTDPSAFDIVITDLSMPNMTGLDLVRRVRRVRADIPIIMVTGYLTDVDEAAAHAAGANVILDKAASVHRLGDAVDRAFAPQIA